MYPTLGESTNDLGKNIRRIVCTTLDETTARRKIEDAIRKTAQESNVPAIAVDQSFTNKLLKLPLAERATTLRQHGYQIPKEWTVSH